MPTLGVDPLTVMPAGTMAVLTLSAASLAASKVGSRTSAVVI